MRMRGRFDRRVMAVVVGLAGWAGASGAQETSVVTEAAPREDRLPVTAVVPERVKGAFTLFGPIADERRDEAATHNGRVGAETVPLPPPSVLTVSPETIATPKFEPEARFEPVAAYAPAETAPVVAIDKALEKASGRVIAVPLPRRRPTPPPPVQASAPVQVADLGAAPGETLPKAVAAEVAPVLAEEAVLGEPKRIPKEALPYLSILRREAAANKVPLWLAIGVGWVESKYNPRLRGTHSVVGIMQVMPSTARFQGYKGTAEQLFDPETNIVWGLRELGWDYAKAGGNACLAVAKYKGGIATKTIPSAAASYCAAAKRVTGMM